MANGHGGVRVFGFLHQQRRHWFADDVSTAQNDNLSSAERNVRFDKQFMNAGRRAGNESTRVAEQKFADVVRMKSIHVFGSANRRINFRRVDMTRDWRLHQNTVDVWIGV